jgi:hypothetical protein
MASSRLILDHENRGARRADSPGNVKRSTVGEQGFERAQRLYLRGFGLHDVDICRQIIRAQRDGQPDRALSRVTVSREMIAFPADLPGGQCLYFGDAAVAHAVGHLRYSTPGRAVGAKVPMMIAVHSLIEDARIERLMIREFPGLWGLWDRFHRMGGNPSEKGLTFEALAERLALALHDASYCDPHHWVNKARDLVDAIGSELHDVSRFQEVASVLASDLGQMRVRFDPQSYVIEPSYRDDNAYLWHFNEADSHSAVAEGKGAQAQELNKPGSGAEDVEGDEDNDTQAEVAGLLYPEWNYKAKVLREDWVTVVEGRPLRVGDANVTELSGNKRETVQRIRHRQIFSTHRVRRQRDGDELDLDALIDHVVMQRYGGQADGNVFIRLGRQPREASVLVLLDLSASTARLIEGTSVTLLDCERNAAEHAIEAFESAQTRIALHGFSSNGRGEVRYLRLKDFGLPYHDEVRRQVKALLPAWSTRFGAALRHAGACLSTETSPSRTIILVTDGEPSDIDVFDANYLIEDARYAVDELAANGVLTQCISVDPTAHSGICQIFGRRNCVSIGRTSRLVDVLPDVLARAVA